MIYSYLKVSLRNILKYKVFSFINIFGLAAAMSVSMLLILMLADQRSYDRFQVNRERTYRVITDGPGFKNPYATSAFPLAGVLKTGDPMIEEVTRLMSGVGGDGAYGQRSAEMRGYIADTSFFRVFSFELAEGNPEEALRAPYSMVLSAQMASRLFGTADPMGKTIEFSDRGLNRMGVTGSDSARSWGSFVVTGVLRDKPYKSHLQFDVLVSGASLKALDMRNKVRDLTGNWNDIYHCYTYARLTPGKSGADLDASLARLAAKVYKDIPDCKGYRLQGQQLSRISPGILLGNDTHTSLPRIVYYFLGLLALVIMGSACLNYTNLSIARALTRAKEIGIRKVNGAGRRSLVIQFICEAVLTAGIALGMAFVLLLLVRSAFLHLWINQFLHFDLQLNLPVVLAFAGFALLIGLIAGLYPAFYLSRFRPVIVLRSFSSLRPGKLRMQRVLSVLQFSVSLLFIISSILIFNQSTHFLKFEYEFNPNDIVNVSLEGHDYRQVAISLGAVPGVQKVSGCDYIPVTGRNEGTSMKIVGKTDAYQSLSVLQADGNFVDNLGLKLAAGKNLPGGFSSSHYVLLNEAAVKMFGYHHPTEIIGQLLTFQGNDSTPVEVSGVLKDFHTNLDHDGVMPLVIGDHPERFRYVNVRIIGVDRAATVARLERKWKTIDPVHAFRYQFFEDEQAATSMGFFDVVSVLGYMAFIAVTIACLGMLGMATYTTERRVKEMGIRKTLGAGTTRILLLLSSSFIRVLVIAILIAAPASWLINNLWLRKFPNRVDFGWETILSGSLLLLVLGLVTVGSRTLRAAMRNPVEALRTE